MYDMCDIPPCGKISDISNNRTLCDWHLSSTEPQQLCVALPSAAAGEAVVLLQQAAGGVQNPHQGVGPQLELRVLLGKEPGQLRGGALPGLGLQK